MKLYANCKNCKKDFALKNSFNTRPDLVDKLGEYFPLQCTHCISTKEYHANDINAHDGIGLKYAGTALGLGIIVLFTLFIWGQGFITNIGLILGGGVIAASQLSSSSSTTHAFNRYKITRNPKE